MEDLQKSINELVELNKSIQEETKIYYASMEKQLEEIKVLTHYTLSEQEKLRISQMTSKELLVEIQNNIDEIRTKIDKFDKALSPKQKDKDNKVVDWESYALFKKGSEM